MLKIRFVARFVMMAALIGISRERVACAQTPETGPAQSAAKTVINNADFASELDAVTAQLKAKFDTGKTNAADLQENLKAINALISKHFIGGKREQVARLYLLDAHLYADGLNDKNRAQAIWEQVLRDFPGTLAAQGAKLSLDQITPEGLEVGQRFPDFDAAGLSVSSRLGRVTLIDFWATWCGPCREEMPNVIAAYQTFHPQGFEIIGVSLDEEGLGLRDYIQMHGMPWPQYFDGLGWQNKLAVSYGVKSIPANYLLDRHGIIVGKNLRGGNLLEAVAKAMTGR